MVYENLKNIFLKFSTKIVTEEDLENLEFKRIPKDLEFKGLDYFLD